MALRPRWSRRKFLIGVGGIAPGLAAVGLFVQDTSAIVELQFGSDGEYQ